MPYQRADVDVTARLGAGRFQASVSECRRGGAAGRRQHCDGRRHADAAGTKLQRSAVSATSAGHQLKGVNT